MLDRIGRRWSWASRSGDLHVPHEVQKVDVVRMYDTYMPNKTISVPDDVVPIIDGLGVPFSTWVANQLRRHAATQSSMGFAQQLLVDADLATAEPPTTAESSAALERMERSAPW